MEILVVGVYPALFEVQELHRAQGLDVLLGAVLAVEAARHEVRAVVFFEQAALEHLDAGGQRQVTIPRQSWGNAFGC